MYKVIIGVFLINIACGIFGEGLRKRTKIPSLLISIVTLEYIDPCLSKQLIS